MLAHNPLKVLIACLLVLAAATVWGLGIFDRLTNGGFEDPEAESSRITTEAKKHFGDTNPDLVVLYKNHHGSINDPAVLSQVQRDIQAIPSSEYTQVVPWYATKDSPLVNQDGTAGMVLITLAGEDEDAKLVNYQAIVDQLQVDGLETHVSGMYPMFDEINTLATNSIYKTEIIAIPVVFLLSIAIFGSLVAALMPTIVGVAAVWPPTSAGAGASTARMSRSRSCEAGDCGRPSHCTWIIVAGSVPGLVWLTTVALWTPSTAFSLVR